MESSDTVIHECPPPRPFSHRLLIADSVSGGFPKCYVPKDELSCGWAIVQATDEAETGSDGNTNSSYALSASPDAVASGYMRQSTMDVPSSSLTLHQRPATSTSAEAETSIVVTSYQQDMGKNGEELAG